MEDYIIYIDGQAFVLSQEVDDQSFDEHFETDVEAMIEEIINFANTFYHRR